MQLRSIFLSLFLALSAGLFAERAFVHPGLAHKQSDIDRMKAMVAAKAEPWYTSFRNLSAHSQAQADYVVQGNPSWTKVVQDGENYKAFTSDIRAAYLNALMWVITGNEAHARKSVEIFNAWKNLTNFQTTSTESLEAGRVGWILVEAAELIKSTYDGWAADDLQAFKDMLVYPGYSNTEAPAANQTKTIYWHAYMGDWGRHGNQGLFGWRVVMAMGVFLDNEIMYDRAYRYFTAQSRRADDLPYVAGPPTLAESPSGTNDYFDTYPVGSIPADAAADYGYNGVLPYYIWENGQCQESSRDQDHAALGLGMIASMAEIAWNQGDDIYSMFDNRILTAYQWALRYNVSYKYPYPDQLEPWEPTGYTTEENVATFENGMFIQRRDRSGRWYSKMPNPHYEGNFENISRGNFHAYKRPVYELAYAHYKVRAGMSDEDVKWIKRANEISNHENGYEQEGWSLDHLGFGGLTCHRTEWMAGDPVSYASGSREYAMPQLPCTLPAVDFDAYTGSGQGHTYNDLTSGNSGNCYRTDADVDLAAGDNGYVVTDMETGEWISYTVANPQNATYLVSVRHKTTAEGARLKVQADNAAETENTLPVGSEYQLSPIGTINLAAGCNVLRICVTGASNATELSQIVITQSESAEATISLQGELVAGSGAELSWEMWNAQPAKVSIYRGATENFSDAEMVAEIADATRYMDENMDAAQNSFFYWVGYQENADAEPVLSNPITLSWGWFYDTFTDLDYKWQATNPSLVPYLADSALMVPYPATRTVMLNRTGGANLHAGNYPVLAVRVEVSDGVQIGIYNGNRSQLGGAADSYSGRLSDNVYYYDLTEVGFVDNSGTTMVPENENMYNRLLQLRLTAPDENAPHAKLHWIGTFATLAELEALYPPLSALSQTGANGITCRTDGRWLTIGSSQNSLNTTSIFALNGQLLSQTTWKGNMQCLLPAAGVYLLKTQTPDSNIVTKILVR